MFPPAISRSTNFAVICCWAGGGKHRRRTYVKGGLQTSTVFVAWGYGDGSPSVRLSGVRERVKDCGAEAILYRVGCSEDVARQRVADRNRQSHRSLYIAPETFDFLKVRFQPLQPQERYRPTP